MKFDLITNYIYIYQLDQYVIIPTYPESINDSLGSTFNTTNALSRTAPIQAYANSGPRKVQIVLNLDRDMMADFNYQNSKLIADIQLGDDYVDTLVRYLQAMALPSYKVQEASAAMVNPPEICCRFGNTLFIRGVVTGDVSVTYSGPISSDQKYQQVDVTFNVTEIDPQDADTLAQWGSFRGMESALTKKMFKS